MMSNVWDLRIDAPGGEIEQRRPTRGQFEVPEIDLDPRTRGGP
jgi:hypothetical protein